jgi:hypothetical protein
VQHEVGAPHAELVELGAEVAGVALDRDVEVARLVGLAEAGERDRDPPRERGGAQDELAEVLVRAGVAVDEDDRLLGVRRAGFQDGSPNPGGGDLTDARGVGGDGGRC